MSLSDTFDSLCQWPFLSWVALVGLVLLLVARGRMGDERSEMTGGALPDQFPVDSKRIVPSVSEGSHHYEVQFTDSEGSAQSVQVSKSVYRRTSKGDQITVHRNPRSAGYVHESEPLSYARASTSILWAVAWILIFIGVLDLVVFLIIDESPWCVVINR